MTGSVSGAIGRWGLLLSLVLIANAIPAHGDVTTERSSSILIFPKVVASSAGLDTFIQISNTSNSMVFAHCFYVNAAPLDPTKPASDSNPAQWQEVDFDILLTRQQPTHWLVSEGRRFDVNDPTDRECDVNFRDCNGAGFDPGAVPPVSDEFTGELKCVEVDISGAPISGNALKGEATIVTSDGDASKYNAVGVVGLPANDGQSPLCLGGGVRPGCKAGAEYDGCPQTLILSHFADKATDPVVEELGNGPSQVTSELTLVPCTEDFEDQIPAQVTVQFLLINEFEEQFSASITMTCWANLPLSTGINPIFSFAFLGSRFVQTRITALADGQSGLVGVAEEFHSQPGTEGALVSRAAFNLDVEGQRALGDIIILPEAP